VVWLFTAYLNKMDFAKKKAEKDEWFTPKEAIYPILRYLKKNSIIWCPFDTKESNFVKILEAERHIVHATHICNGEDFFNCKIPSECEYIISNPPYSKRNKILKRLFELGKPFAMLMNTNGLFDSDLRWNLFKKNNFTLIYLKGRVNYMEKYGEKQKSSPPFQSAYICSWLSDNQIIFGDNANGGTNFTKSSADDFPYQESLIAINQNQKTIG